MGYEVMDAHGARTAPTGAGDVPPLDVVDLTPDDDPAPAANADRPQRLAALWAGRREIVLSVTVALVVGALLGGFVTGQRAAADQRAARRSQLAVVAQLESSSLSRQGAGVQADLTARVTNSGPEEVDVETTSATSTPSRLNPVAVSGGRALEPGESAAVRVLVLLQCGVTPLPDLAVTVRTADGRPHAVPLQPRYGDGALTALCSDTSAAASLVTARVEGTLGRPVVVVENGGDTVVGVSFASVVSRGTPEVEGLITILTSPGMPLIVGAHRERSVVVNVRATRCASDLRTLSTLTEISRPSLIVTDSNGSVLQGGAPGGVTSVDLSPLVSQALARACA